MKKHILCFGDSNTHGLCADPNDCADGGNRFNEDERWTCLLQSKLGHDYLVIEEGQSGRTTVFPDPCYESRDALPVLYSILMSHEPIDLLVVMLGTNDTKEWLGINMAGIELGMERLLTKAISIDCWGGKRPNILLISPPPIEKGYSMTYFGQGTSCVKKSESISKCYASVAKRLGMHFMDARGCEMNSVDFCHLTKRGHAQMAEQLSKLIPTLIP